MEKTNDALVSIIMPAYNAEKYITQSIDSVLNQTYENFELLVVNDASTDGTAEIIRDLAAKDGRVKLLQNTHGKGVAGGINTGLKNAKGKYIARADADDINRPYRLEKQVAFLEAHSEIFLVGGGYAPFNERGHMFDALHPTSSLEIAWRFLTNTFFCHPSVMFRREVYETLGTYPNVEAEDFAYFSGVVQKYRCANLPEILIDYRNSLGNRSNSAAERIACSVRLQAEKNYRHYVGDTKDFDIFFNYQNGRKLSLKNWWKVMTINGKILDKIMADYGMRKPSRECIRLRLLILAESFQRILRR